MEQRDLDVVLSIYKYRYLKTSQIQQLFFASLQTTRRSLRRLRTRELIKSFKVSDITEEIHCLRTQGAKLVALQFRTTIDNLKWSKHTHTPKDYYYTKHFLQTNQFRIDITKACDKSDINLAGFIPEYYGEKHPSGRILKRITDFTFDIADPRDKISHTPDAVFALSRENQAGLFFLEIDRGTQRPLNNPSKGFLKMIRFYLGYAKDRKFKTYRAEFNCGELTYFKLLIVTTNQKRLENMRQASSSYFDTYLNVLKWFWVTTLDQVNENTMWNLIWQSLDASDLVNHGLGWFVFG